MKKVLFCAYSLGLGGIETSIVNLLNNFDYNKYDVTLILEKKEGLLLNKINKNVKIEEYRVSECKNIIIRKIYNFTKRILWIIKNRNKYDFSCCYATYSLPNNFQGYYGSKNNCMFVHNDYTNTYKTKDELDNFFLKRRIFKYKKLVFVSNESRDATVKIYPEIESKSVVINNIINNKEIIELSKEKINENTNKKLFVYIGRLDEEQKRISRMINVFKKINNCELWLVGSGPDKEKYESMIKDVSNIKLLGPKSNPYPYIKRADFIIFTSEYEGFPVVYNEAIILNTPIITTLDLSDDYVSIKDRFGYIIDKDENIMYNQINDILNIKNVNIEKVDFNKLNKERIKKIESLIEGENDEI